MEEIKPSPKAHEHPPYLRFLEIILGFLGGFNCVLVPLFFSFQELSLRRVPGDSWQFSAIWPFPAIYFIEILFIGLATTYFVATNHISHPTRWSGLPWISAGILLTFVIFGIFSIGLFLIPAMLCFLAAGILGDRRQGGNWPTHVIFFLFAAMVQAVAVYLFLILFLR